MNKNKKYSISVILPVYNEEKNIEKVINNSVRYLQSQAIFLEYEIIVINDGSKDDTPDILRKYSNFHYLKVITHRKNLGYGMALISGIEASRYPLIFFMDADGQFNISDIRKLLPYIDKFDIVMGNRLVRHDQFYRVIMGKIYNLLICLLFSMDTKDITCGFKLIKRTLFDKIELKSRGGFINAEILIKAKMLCYSIKEVAISHFLRRGGSQTGAGLKAIKMKLSDMFRMWREIQR